MILKINNWINGNEVKPINNNWLKKINPHNRKVISYYADSQKDDINNAVEVASDAFTTWSNFTPVKRGEILYRYAEEMIRETMVLAECVAKETGKSLEDSVGEVNASIAQAQFFAGEGRRLYGSSFTSVIKGKYSHSIREPHGTVGLIIPANTPIANIAWKIFPALICGNSIVLKASEDAPEIALLLAKISKSIGLPNGVFNVVQGLGESAGVPLVKHNLIKLISFTGSTEVGISIGKIVSQRMGRISLELGGKNSLIICDDADLDNAVNWAILSAFSNAGQRCASGSKIIIFENIYKLFVKKLIAKTSQLKLGINKGSDLGPVINQNQYNIILNSINTAVKQGGRVIIGGDLPNDKELQNGFYINPTLIENLTVNSDFCQKEIFGPVAALIKVKDINHAIDISNSSNFGLTAAIHTKNLDQGIWFAQKVKAGTVNINGGTYGSEPHMPFGGIGFSGNGTREPGTEALNVYSELKNISFFIKEP